MSNDLSASQADTDDPIVYIGRMAAASYPDVTMVSYAETSDGIVTAIYRHWPQALFSGYYHHTCNACDRTGGHCLIQVKGKIREQDAPLFDAAILDR